MLSPLPFLSALIRVLKSGEKEKVPLATAGILLTATPRDVDTLAQRLLHLLNTKNDKSD